MEWITLGADRIEYERIAGAAADCQTIVLLHEGLGCVSMWRDFPTRLARATGLHVLVYSRRGYGRSSALRGSRTVRYLHEEALELLPQLLDALAISNPILFGHSDGSSIALIHAGAGNRPVAGIIALAPHTFVEEISIRNIAATRTAFMTSDLRERLARHHKDVDGAFWGWNGIWLDPQFLTWNIGEYLPRIACPILAIQGRNDEYGTMQQLDRIARSAPRVELLKLEDCAHAPHRDQPERVLHAVAQWIRARSGGN